MFVNHSSPKADHFAFLLKKMLLQQKKMLSTNNIQRSVNVCSVATELMHVCCSVVQKLVEVMPYLLWTLSSSAFVKMFAISK